MENIKIAEVCGLCAGCKHAINTVVKEIESGKKITIFKEIVHNKNVHRFLSSIGAKCVNDIAMISSADLVVIRAHGEPPSTYLEFNKNKIEFIDCTCHNVTAIHNLVVQYSNDGYKIIILGKYKKSIHPEVLGTMGWAKTEVILIETCEDIDKLKSFRKQKFYLVCQTTFNETKAYEIIPKIEELLKTNHCELVVNKSICVAQKVINQFSAKLAHDSDIMIVVGGLNSSNSLELYNNMSAICPSIFIEDINKYKDALKEKGLTIAPTTKVGITAGASTMREELIELKSLIEQELSF